MEISNAQIMEISKSVWSSMLGVDVAASAPVQIPHGAERFTVGSVQISGDWSGVISLACPSTLAREAAALMFGVEADKATAQEIQDAWGEIVNMIGGNIKSLIPGSCQLGLPTVAEGREFCVVIPGVTLKGKHYFLCGDKPFTVEVHEKQSSTTSSRLVAQTAAAK
jgi:chemotaxis protein CheX